MTRATLAAILLPFAPALAACSGSDAVMSPSAPSRVTAQAAPSGGLYGLGYTRQGVALFGVLFEPTPAGPVPIADALVYCDACGEFGHTSTRTDANGYYSFNGDLSTGGGVWLSGARTPLLVRKDGYRDPPDLTPPAPLGARVGRAIRTERDLF